MKFWWNWRKRDAELEKEIQHHLRMAEADRVERGSLADNARAGARREFGNVGLAKELARDVWGWRWMRDLHEDLRYGVRTLAKNKGFAAVAVLALALGIGANTTIFSMVNAVLLRPLPYPDPDSLVVISGISAVRLNSEQQRLEWVRSMQHTRTLEQVAAYDTGWANLAAAGKPERVFLAEVSASLFPVLGIAPAEGRTFLPEEDQAGHPFVAVVSEELARNKFGSASASIGRTLKLNGKVFTIVGVMPAEFDFPSETQIWVPLPWDLKDRMFNEGLIFYSQIARLNPRTTVAQARAEMVAVASQPPGNLLDAESLVQVITMHGAKSGEVRQGVLLLMGAVAFVLLIACTNIANMLLARALGRRKEMAVRAALGATRGRLIRQAFAESLLLAAMGGLGGFFLSGWALNFLRMLLPVRMEGTASAQTDYRVLFFVAAASFGSAFLFGLLPALIGSKPDVREGLQDRPLTSAAARIVPYHARGLLVISEVALAFVLLVGADLLIQSLGRLMRVPTGFQTQHLLTTRLVLADARYEKPEQQVAFYRESLQRIEALPGVQSAAFVQDLPFGEAPSTMFLLRTEEKSAAGGAHDMIVSPSYFRTLSIPLLAGREFAEGDREGAPKVAVISKSLAHDLWPGENPLGRRVALHDPKFPWLEIVGIVDDTRHFGLDHESMPISTLYLPMWQNARPTGFLAVRTAGDSKALAGALRSAVASVDKDEPLGSFATMTQLISMRTAEPRFRTLLLAVFAGLALILATIGVYGVVSYSVGQRVREIGIRLALGAERIDVVRLVVGQGLVLVVSGIVVGFGAALGLTRLLTSFLFEVKSTDAAAYVIACIAFAAVALVASYVPALRCGWIRWWC